MRARCNTDDKLMIKNVNKNKSVRYHYMERGSDEGTKERFKQKPYGMKEVENNEGRYKKYN